jgi:hypothetical protein
MVRMHSRALGPKAKMGKLGPCRVQNILLILTICLDTILTSNTPMALDFNFPLSISSINCNSLNMSNTGSFNHKLKMYGITKLKTDIILMCDIRLSNSQNVLQSIPAKTTFRTNPYGSYDFFSNSNKNKRGVGILLKKSCNFSVLEEWRDGADENYLLLKLQQPGTNSPFYVGAIYGPNNVEPRFFEGLCTHLRNAGNLPIILGGDWNCLYSNEPVRTNPDVVNMQAVPNKRHSYLLLEMCEQFLLADPYRVKYPNKKEFIYVPSDVTKKNRSRLDFFYNI